MKIRSVSLNNRKREFAVVIRTGAAYPFPYAKAEPTPDAGDPVDQLFVDQELGNEAFTFVLQSGQEGSVHIEQVLDFNRDPQYLANELTYMLTVEARKRLEKSGLSRRQLARRLRTSVPQLYRLLDPANTRKSMTRLIALLHVLDCDVEVVVKDKAA